MSNQTEKSFQVYTSAKPSMKMVTPRGRVFSFANYRLITEDKDIINYLDSEIEAGFHHVTKGEPVTSEEADPMASYKAKVIAEYEEKKAKEAAELALRGPKDMGTSSQGKLSPASTASLVGNAVNSASTGK